MADREFGIETLCLHAGQIPDSQTGSRAVPLYQTTSFVFDSAEHAASLFNLQTFGNVYTRLSNPTTAVFEEHVAALEGGRAAVATASGQAAEMVALLNIVEAGDHIVSSNKLYGGTHTMFAVNFRKLGIEATLVDPDEPGNFRKALRPNTKAIFSETLGNPAINMVDLEAVGKIAHEAGIPFVVDNTAASPYLCQPLKHGADIVVHSATKFLCGHADAMGGIAISRDETDSPALIGVMKLVGGVLSPWEAHAILRGLKTLAVRMDRHCENALALAERLRNNPRISRVYYAGGGEIAKRVLREPHAGALVSIELKDNSRAAAFRFMDALQLCIRSTSLGDVFTSALHPATASHRDLAPARRKELGISDGLVRISVGIESVSDIITDIEQALEK